MKEENEILSREEIVEYISGGFIKISLDKYDCMNAMQIYSDQQVKRAIKSVIFDLSIGDYGRMYHEKKYLKEITKEIIKEINKEP